MVEARDRGDDNVVGEGERYLCWRGGSLYLTSPSVRRGYKEELACDVECDVDGLEDVGDGREERDDTEVDNEDAAAAVSFAGGPLCTVPLVNFGSIGSGRVAERALFGAVFSLTIWRTFLVVRSTGES